MSSESRRFSIPDIVAGERARGEDWEEFVRSDLLSAGVYRLEVGATDDQSPHTEDELYYVIAGRAKLWLEGATLDAGPGDALFVPANAEHRFVEIEEELEVLVFFAPPEYSQEQQKP